MSLREELKENFADYCTVNEMKVDCNKNLCVSCERDFYKKIAFKNIELLHQERQAKEELLEAVQRLFDLRKRKKVRIFNAEVSFDKEIEQLITKHTQER